MQPAQRFAIQHGCLFGAGSSGGPKITTMLSETTLKISGAGPQSTEITVRGGNIYGPQPTHSFGQRVSFINSSSPYIANNVIRNNTGRGAVNLTLPTGNTPVVMNNTIVGNTGAAIKIDTRVNQSTVVVANNILLGNSAGIQLDFGTAENWNVRIQ
jgi:hypothetical protein